MKLLALVCLLAIIACNNAAEESTPKKDTASTAPVEKAPDNKITFKVDEAMVSSTAWNINRFDFRNGAGVAINITSSSKDEPRTVNLNVNATQPGSYPFDASGSALNTPGKAYGDYMPDANAEKKDHYFFKTGTLTIIDIDTAKNILNATFSGEAKNDKGKTIQVTDGKVLMGVMKPGVTTL